MGTGSGGSPAVRVRMICAGVTARPSHSSTAGAGRQVVFWAQLERLLELGQLWNVEIQVMPTDREDQ